MHTADGSPIISIIVPVYKVEPYLNKCVDSIVGQTCGDLDIILVDDGSPDRCPALCDEWAERDSRIRVLHRENGGLSDARNAGIDAAAGKYLLFVDSDDYIKPDACEKLLGYAEAHGGDLDIVIGDAEIDIDGRLVHPKHRPETIGVVMSGPEYLKSELPPFKIYPQAWLRMYRTGFLRANGLYFRKGRLHEDNEFLPRVFIPAQRVVYTGICFYHYNKRSGSISRRDDLSGNAAHIIATCREMAEAAKSLEDRQLAAVLDNYAVDLYLNVFQAAGLHKRRHRNLIDTDFLKGKALTRRNKCRVALFRFDRNLYHLVNRLSKKL